MGKDQLELDKAQPLHEIHYLSYEAPLVEISYEADLTCVARIEHQLIQFQETILSTTTKRRTQIMFLLTRKQLSLIVLIFLHVVWNGELILEWLLFPSRCLVGTEAQCLLNCCAWLVIHFQAAYLLCQISVQYQQVPGMNINKGVNSAHLNSNEYKLAEKSHI